MVAKPVILDNEEQEEINKILLTLLRSAEAKCALLIGQDGQCVAKRGFTKKIDTDALAVLIAGSFASTREMAKLLGESDFSVLFHQGTKDHIHNILVNEDIILTVLFDDRTTLGMVRLYSREAAKKLRPILMKASGKKTQKIKGIEKEAEKRIDDLIK